MQFEFVWPRPRARSQPETLLRLGAEWIPLRFMPNRRARRYVLRLTRDGAARVTVPRGGSLAEATRFAERHIAWIEQQLQKQLLRAREDRTWKIGTEVLWRGERVPIQTAHATNMQSVRFASEVVRVADQTGNLRPELELHMWRIAGRELPARVLELAAMHGFQVRRVTVRNQRSRWGSCSRRGTISLNWRLVQTPGAICDYIILHELAHLREMNHSARFWGEVERLCPRFMEAERWLKQRPGLLG